MLELQQNITRVQSATAKLRDSLVEEATREYFTTLDVLGSPSTSDFEAAQERARVVLKQELLSARAVTKIADGVELDEEILAELAIGFDAISRPLRVPRPTVSAEAKPMTLALAGAGGAFGGMLGGAALLRLAFDMRDLGLAVGAPAGAFVAVLIVYGLARTRIITKILPWLFVRPRALRGATRSEHEKAVRAAIEQWVEWAVSMLTVLCMHRAVPPETRTDTDKALRRIGKLIYTLHGSPPELLPVVAHELIQEAKNSGFEGLQGQPHFLEAGAATTETIVWEPGLQNQYETFGHITEGDQVTIERPAVVFGGRVVQRGLVRRVRDRT